MGELKPCRACGSANVRVRHETDSCGWRNFFVACDECSYRGPTVHAPYHGRNDEYEKKAANAWSMRTRSVTTRWSHA